MNILVTGATGFIGSALVAKLLGGGYRVTAVAHRSAARRADVPKLRWIVQDLGTARTEEIWAPHLAGIDAVVNCAGVLQGGPGDDPAAVHAHGIATLFAASEARGIKVIHLSAIGVDRETPSDFSRTKQAGDADLMQRSLPWVILRPSVVVGRAANGGSALFRGLAALPLLPEIKAAGRLHVVQLDELLQTILFFLRPDAPTRVTLEIAGPEALSLPDVAAAYRSWLGWPPARVFTLPGWAAGLMYLAGDIAGRLGWRSPIRSNARRELVRGAVGDPLPWTRLTGIKPRKLGDALRAEPASVQERWYARLYFLTPLAHVVFALFWIATGLISLGPGWGTGVSLMMEGGAGPRAGPSVVAGAFADIAVGVFMLFRRTARLALYAAIGLTVFYIIAGSLLMPRLWADPLGPMLKIWPVLMLNFILIALLEERRR